MSFEDVLSYYKNIVTLIRIHGYCDDNLMNNQVEMIGDNQQLVLYRNEICLVEEGTINKMRPLYLDRDNVVRQTKEVIGYLNLEKLSLSEVIQNSKMVKLIK